ncbi:MAG: hypothetical protein QMD36_04350 [Candidatus Aenigmarchaeota archaeon]|nr:hypothetical protein [Candidatus Aenigmarchaeota archaeon]
MKKREIKIFLTFFLIYSFFVQWTSWNEESRFALTRAIVDEKRFEIDSFYNQTGDRAVYNGHYYSVKFPGTSFLATPIYKIWNLIYYNFFSLSSANRGSEALVYYTHTHVPLIYVPNPGTFLLISMVLVTVFSSSLFSALTVLLIYKILRYFTKNETHRLLITLSFALGSLAFPYALVFLDHVPEAFFLFSAFYLLFKTKTGGLTQKKYFLLSGLLVGFGFVIRITALIPILLFSVYILFFDRRKLPLFVLGCIMGSLPFLIYHHSVIKDSIRFIFSYTDRPVWFGPDTPKMTFFNSYFMTLMHPSVGLFFFYPILALAIVGFFYMYKKYKAEALIILFLFILITFLVCNLNYGFSFGARHLFTFIPFLMIPLLFTLKKINIRIFQLFLILSIFVNLLGLQFWEGTDPATGYKILKNPIFDHYIPLSLKNGPRSMIFESLLFDSKIDIRNTPHSCGLTPPVLQKEVISLFSLPSVGVIALRIPFLSLVPIGVIMFLIWRKEILRKISLNFRQRLCILFVLILIFILSFIRIETFLYGDNWYAQEFHDGKINENERWVSQNATLILFNKNREIEKTNLIFEIEAFNRTRVLELYLNGNLISTHEIYNKKTISQEMELEPGENVLKFHSVPSCDRPTELGLADCDLRCLSFRIGNIRAEDLDKYLIG